MKRVVVEVTDKGWSVSLYDGDELSRAVHWRKATDLLGGWRTTEPIDWHEELPDFPELAETIEVTTFNMSDIAEAIRDGE